MLATPKNQVEFRMLGWWQRNGRVDRHLNTCQASSGSGQAERVRPRPVCWRADQRTVAITTSRMGHLQDALQDM